MLIYAFEQVLQKSEPVFVIVLQNSYLKIGKSYDKLMITI